MTESRDQRFFDALNSADEDDDRDPSAGTATNTGASEAPQPATHDYSSSRFAADESQDDPDSGRHHIGAGAGDTPGAWGQPEGHRWGESSPQPGAPTRAPSGADSTPQPPPMPPREPAETFTPQAFPSPPSVSNQTSETPAPPQDHRSTEQSRGAGEPAWPAGMNEQEHPPAAAPPGRYPRPSAPSPEGGPDPQRVPSARPTPPPVPPEERTQFISREALRNALPPNTPPPPGWTGPPAGGQRPSPPPQGWPGRGPDQPPSEAAPAGPRPPEWNWSQSGGTGGSELRSEQISASELNAPRKIPSSRGWRKWLYYGSFKLINTGESPDEQLLRNLNATVAGHLRGTYSIVVLGGKGGVGKTTTTAAIGSTFASLRKDKVIAIDANPDRASNLADRIDPSATNSYKDVLADRNLHGYSDIRSHVGMNESAGLDVLGNRYQSDRQPLTAKTYTDTHAVLRRFYSVLISDSGTDVDHQVIPGLMGSADALMMVASTAPDGAKGAAELMDWAYEAGYHRLLQRTVVVINDVRGEKGGSHRKLVASLVEKFSRWVGPQRVFVVPFDPHIASAGVIDINELRPTTRRRFLEITAQVAGGFNSSEDRQ